jgi:hypothetical protein
MAGWARTVDRRHEVQKFLNASRVDVAFTAFFALGPVCLRREPNYTSVNSEPFPQGQNGQLVPKLMTS